MSPIYSNNGLIWNSLFQTEMLTTLTQRTRHESLPTLHLHHRDRPPRWPSGYRIRLKSGRSQVRIPLAPGLFRGWVTPVTSKLAPQWLPCQAPGGIGSVLGLVGPVSVYCEWVRWKVWSATSTSLWQHVKLSEQIHPWDTLTCCWNVKQQTNQPTTGSDRPCCLQVFSKNTNDTEQCNLWFLTIYSLCCSLLWARSHGSNGKHLNCHA